MFTKLTNMIGKIKHVLGLYGVNLNAKNVLLSHEYPRHNRDVCATSHVSLMTLSSKPCQTSNAASIHQGHKLGKPAAAFLHIFCSQAGSDLCCYGC